MQKILIIYTGGTIGMIQNEDGVLQPFSFDNLMSNIPVLRKFPAEISSFAFDKPIDSSDADPAFWVHIVEVIEANYDRYDGFVVLHGSDTMAYTASALSFMLENLAKPVILTGSQLPIGLLRTDGRENIITAVELACMNHNGKPTIGEVCVYFEDNLYRGNRTNKFSAQHFDAFISPNYPALAKVGIDIQLFDDKLWKTCSNAPLLTHKEMCTDIALIKLFPGIMPAFVEAVVAIPHLRGLIVECFGSGNAPTDGRLVGILRKAVDKGIVVVNITQCTVGTVQHGKYAASLQLDKIGVVSGKDLTTEAAVTKMMFLLGQNLPYDDICTIMGTSLRGEITP